MDDKTIKTLLFERSENALGEISEKYSGLYKKVIRDILNDENDVEECEDDVLLALWNSIPPNDPESLPAYICTVARRIGINRYKHNKRQKRGDGLVYTVSELEDCIQYTTSENTSVSQAYADHINRVLSNFLSALDVETRILFVRRYVFFESVKSLADRFDMKENTVSVKLYRARRKLKKTLRMEGIYI